MPLLSSILTMDAASYARLVHGVALRPAPPARADGPVADDAEHVRPERRIDAMDTNRPDYDAVPEHDPDGTPWAA